LQNIEPSTVRQGSFVRAYDTRILTVFAREYLFDSVWSYERGYRYNFPKTCPVLYLAADHLVASSEIGPRTRSELLVPHIQSATDPYLYFTVKLSAALLDLTDQKVRSSLGVTHSELIIPTDDWNDEMKRGRKSVTHHIGALALKDRRFDGILYPPYPSEHLLGIVGKQNVAVFMDADSEAMAQPLGSSVVLDVVDSGHVLKTLGLKV
jgi:RES domain-containing protein